MARATKAASNVPWSGKTNDVVDGGERRQSLIYVLIAANGAGGVSR